MKLADDIVITLGGEEVILHPSLRNAIRLERRPGSFDKLLQEIAEGSLSAAVEIIADHHDHPMLKSRILEARIDALAMPLLTYVVALNRNAARLGDDGSRCQRA